MRTVQDALAAVLASTAQARPLDVVLADAVGCVLAEDVVAPGDLPRFASAGTDGYAVAARDVRDAGPTTPLELPVVEDALPGGEPRRLVPGTCVRVTSGAPMPAGADAVVPLEHTDRGTARVAVHRAAYAGQHTVAAASVAARGDTVLAAGLRLGARQLGVAAAVGRSRLRVHPAPRVVVLSVGDELVDPGTPAPLGSVFDANGHALAAAVRDVGASAYRVGVVGDERAALRETVEDQLVRADLLLTTGGLSDDPRDTVPEVLGMLGDVRFDHVAMHPGGRLGFGTVGDGVPVIALPGDPAAAGIAFEVFVRPALRAMAGYTDLYRQTVVARAREELAGAPEARRFLPAVVTGSPDSGYTFSLTGDPHRPSARSLADANALAVVPEQTVLVRPGDAVPCLVLEG